MMTMAFASSSPDGKAEVAQVISIQYLRGIAAIAVVFAHIDEQLANFGEHLNFGWGIAGVDIFFVISGFVMMITTGRTTAGNFIMRRLIRIVPLYYLFTFIFFAIVSLAPSLFKTTAVSSETLLLSLAFVPHYNLGHPDKIWPLIPLGWTINYEMFFYAIFSMVLSFSFGRRIAILGCIFSALLSFRLLIGDGHSSAVYMTYTSPLLFEFLGGMVVAYYFVSMRPMPPTIAVVFIVAGFALLASSIVPGERAIGYGIPAFLVVIGAVSLEKSKRVPIVPVLSLLGDASYSIYLSHIFSLGLLRVVWSRMGLVDAGYSSSAAFAAIGIAVAIGVGIFCYLIVEKPVLAALRNAYGNARRSWKSASIRSG